MKELSDVLARNPPRGGRINPTAIELGLHPKGAQDARMFTDRNRYTELLRISHELVEGRMDNSEFEERVRQMYGTSAYLMFTIDKVLHAIVKQVRFVLFVNSLLHILILETAFLNSDSRNGNRWQNLGSIEPLLS